MAQTSIQTRISDHQRQVPVNRRSTTMNALTKLDKMIGWEILLGDILRAFLNWGGPEVLCVDELVERCQNCIKIFQSSRSDVRPRPDVVEAALMALINLGKFELVVNCSKTQQGWPFLEFFVLLGRICINVQNEAYYSSNFRDVWNASMGETAKFLNWFQFSSWFFFTFQFCRFWASTLESSVSRKRKGSLPILQPSSGSWNGQSLETWSKSLSRFW